jgi:DDE superfamily endonuclease
MLCVPSSLDQLLVLLAPCFTKPTFRTFRAMVLGQVSQTGLRCVTGMLVGARVSGVWHHARAHRFFSTARWSPDHLGLRLCDLIVQWLVPAGLPLTVVIDDTLIRRRGRRVFGCFWHHDHAANSRQGTVAWGNNWVTLGINVRLPFLERTVCLPVLFRLWQQRRPEIPKGKPDPQRPSKPQLALDMLRLLAKRFPDRMIDVVGDAAYTNSALRRLPENVTFTGRLRVNAALYALPDRRPGRGRPARKGAKLPKLDQLAADPNTCWQRQSARRYGKTEQIEICSKQCVWYQAFGGRPVHVVIIKDPASTALQCALISTDLNATPTELIERYAERWATEVAYEEAKDLFGVGEARNRTANAVRRTVPFQFLAMTLTILWYSLHGHHPEDVQAHRQRAPWYLTKTTPAFSDMLAKLRRAIIATQFHPGQGQTPKPQQIAEVQQAWAAAGC